MAPRSSKKFPADPAISDPVTPPPEPQSDSPPKRLRLGCAPLLTGIFVVVVLGQILPRDHTPAGDLPKTQPAPPKTVPPKPVETAKKSSPLPASDKKPDKPPREPVVIANSPWDGSVRQAEKYLKNSQYDAASFEALEWSPVAETKTGYQVRCKFRSKNVLGIYVVQTKLVLMNKFGDVTGVRDADEPKGEAKPGAKKSGAAPDKRNPA